MKRSNQSKEFVSVVKLYKVSWEEIVEVWGVSNFKIVMGERNFKEKIRCQRSGAELDSKSAWNLLC